MIILSSRKLNWSKVVDFLSVLCINFKKFQKFLFSDIIDICMMVNVLFSKLFKNFRN